MIKPYVQKVLVVDQDFMHNLKAQDFTEFKAFSNLDLDTMVITLPLAKSEDIEGFTKFIDPAYLRRGAVLVRPAYSDQFVPIEEFSEELVHRRFGVFSQLCIALGAKRVKISKLDEVEQENSVKSDLSGGASLDALVGKAEVSSKLSLSAKNGQTNQMNLTSHTAATGGPPDWPEADRIIEVYGLHRETLFMDVYNMRRVSSNSLNLHEFSIDTSKDVQRLFDSSLQTRISAMIKIYKGKVEFDKTFGSKENNKSASRLSVLVEF